MLDRILGKPPARNDPDLLVGPSTFDDAGVYRVSDSLALVLTVDFFTPIVDDAHDFGRIAATNSLSDVYAMGGTPVTALNVVAFPDDKLPDHVLADILQGSAAVCEEAGVAIAGGHSVSDEELKFGLAVTGILDPGDGVLSNAGARPGDVLLLTKPLGTGLVANAMMNDAADDDWVRASTESMTRLNRVASELARAHNAHAVTDITGFGLLGHARELALASRVTARFSAEALPALPGALEVASSGSFFSGGEHKNRAFVERFAQIETSIPERLRRLAVDPQTSGGLLLALAPRDADMFSAAIAERGERAWRVGEIVERGRFLLALTR